MNTITILSEWQQVFDNLPPRPTRYHIEKATGLISARTLANRDSLGTGIPGKKVIGKRATYPKDEVIKFILDFVGEKV